MSHTAGLVHTVVHKRFHGRGCQTRQHPCKPSKAGQAPPLVFSSCNKCVVGERANVQCASFLQWRPLRPWETRAARQIDGRQGRRGRRRRFRWSSAGTAAPSPKGTPPPAARDRRGRRGWRGRQGATHELNGNANDFLRCSPFLSPPR